MSGRLVFQIGVSLEEIDRKIAANVEAAIVTAEAGRSLKAKRTISFENWNTFFRHMAPSRIAILVHIAAHDLIAITRALSIALARDYSAVRADAALLVEFGLLERNGTALRCDIEPDAAVLVAA